MKVARTAILSAILLSSLAVVDAFFHQASPAPTSRRPRRRSCNVSGSSVVGRAPPTAVPSTAADAEVPCAGPNDAIPDSVTAQSLRTAVLTNIDGDLVRLDEKMGQGTSIVVFLRHLG